jgi:hypothetical protein
VRTTCMTRSFSCAVLAFATLSFCFVPRAHAAASDFYSAYLQAKVIGHVPLSGRVRQLFLQQEGRRQYLYVQQRSQQGFTVVDVTKPDRPKVVDRVPEETLTAVGSGLAISETPDHSAMANSRVAGISTRARAGSGIVSESVRVLDVSDPAHPRTAQTFDGVTSILPDAARNLIYIANGNGVWVVSHQRVLRRHRCSSSDEMSPMPNCD